MGLVFCITDLIEKKRVQVGSKEKEGKRFIALSSIDSRWQATQYRPDKGPVVLNRILLGWVFGSLLRTWNIKSDREGICN